jgi:putative redox protein
MQAAARWVSGRLFAGETGSGHRVMMDGSPEHGGRNLGARPMEMLLLGIAGCSGFDVVMILEKGRVGLVTCDVEVEAERATEDPKVFTRIHMHYIVKGEGLTDDKVKRAVELSAEKYCSASVMLGKTATITHDWKIRA